MTTLVIPAAGFSTRYGLDRPKFLLQHPLGNTMLTNAISGLGSLEKIGVDSVRIITLKDFFQDISLSRLENEIAKQIGLPIFFELLDKPTSSMVETLCLGLSRLKVDNSFIVKDCDNMISFKEEIMPMSGNIITFIDLAKYPNVVASNKSFLKFGYGRVLENIVEKKIISSLINVGCVRFESASDFLSAAKSINSYGEIYVSDVVRVMLAEGAIFVGVNASEFEDWGTLREWRAYTENFKTYFVDIDGVVVFNENPLSISGGWSSFEPIQSNLDVLLELQSSKRCKIVFTTSRSEEYRSKVHGALEESGFIGFDLLMGLPHAGRVLINDFAATNPYPSAVAVNLPRNASNLKEYL